MGRDTSTTLPERTLTTAVFVAVVALALTLGGLVDDFWYLTELLWLYALVALVAAVRRLEQARPPVRRTNWHG